MGRDENIHDSEESSITDVLKKKPRKSIYGNSPESFVPEKAPREDNERRLSLLHSSASKLKQKQRPFVMKNLSPIPCLSLFEAFTILITLAVCLAAFTEAEVRSNLRKQAGENYPSKEAANGEDVPYSQNAAELKGGGLHPGDFSNSNKFRVGSLEKLIKRQSDDFGESADSELEKESDGYGYDDDEYYHINYKRNDDAVGNAESNKMGKESIGEPSRKEGLSPSQKMTAPKVQKENDKELQTIEMLNFKEFHPNIGGNENPNQNLNSNQNQNQIQNQINQKPFTFENSAHKKLPSSSLDSLNMRDLKENSAIDEKMKDRKEESGGILAGSSGESKAAESKKGLKTSEDKDGAKLKDAKIAESSEKKEKEASLKEAKENVAGKNLKDNAKSSDEKDKSLKLSESAKLEENLEKINAKNKEGETAKITKEEKDSSKLIGKANIDVINPNDISQISNRASFVSSDYKDNLEALKPTAVEEDEKNSDELNENEKNVGLNDYDDLREREEKMRESSLWGKNLNGAGGARQGLAKASDYFSFPVTFEMKGSGDNEYFKKRESWKDHGKFQMQQEQMQIEQAQQQQQQQQQQPTSQEQNAFEHDVKNLYHLKFPPGELENTEYHKNFIKSLKRYKGLSENAKVLTPESTSFSSVEKSSFQENREARKKKRSKTKKRRSMVSGDANSSEGGYMKSRRNDFGDAGRMQWYQGQDLRELKTGEDNPKLFENKKYNGQQENSRQRRKSPAKLEYEIKIINQNQQESKNAPLSNLRMKKEVKTKLATDDKYLKKYPYSQVSRDDLTRLYEPDRKYKRKAPAWVRKDQSKESLIQTRGLPSGYYGNRVKFGQKSYARTEEKPSSEQSISDVKLSYMQTPVEKSSFQRTWEMKTPDYKHDPMKRYDDTGSNSHGSNSHGSNSLLLVRKGQNGDRITKTFEEGKAKESEEKFDTERLAQLLSKDNDYIVLKKTDTNQYTKVSETEPAFTQQEEVSSASQQNKKSAVESQGKQSAKNKGVYARSSHKEDKKFSGLHAPAGKSNLKKTFEKFRDLADFFKDNDQESADNQYQSQEIKEGRDIVFSEDKLPDPIVISSDANGKSDSFNQKPTNSIYSISTNFKHLDQQDRKESSPKDVDINKNMLASEVKQDNQESSWEPALKNAFPEAKSINSMSKDGNEIIVLDFNRNQLKNEHGFLPSGKPNPKGQTLGGGSVWPPGGGRLLNSLGQRQVEVVLPSKMTLFDKNRRDEEKNSAILSFGRQQDGPYAVFSGSEGQQVSIPLNQLAQLPYLFRTLADKKQSVVGASTKSVVKKSAKWSNQQNALSDNYSQFLKDLQALSEMKKKGRLAVKRSSEEVLLPPSSMPEMTSYGDVNLRKLGSLLQNILTSQNSKIEGGKRGMVDSKNQGYQKAWYPAAYDARRQRLSSEANGKADMLLSKAKQDSQLSDANNYKMEVWDELTGVSNDMRRLRREETGKRKLRNALDEDSSSNGAECPADMKDKCMRNPNSRQAAAGKSPSGEKVNEEEEEEEGKENSRSLKSAFEGHLNELFENLSSEKSQKDLINTPNESTPNRGKRKDTDRGKRSSRLDVKNKVSTTEVQNKLLKNLPEDNYPSVYSPGIKRRLLSTENEMEDADGYYKADEHDRSEIAKGGGTNSAKNDRKCIDPIILELFGADDPLSEKNRDRRSLTAGFHSNFKREIDLDESMPNDFQNFLVTSLGGVGSQKREVVKKEEALWEGKEAGQGGYNQIVESSPGGKDVGEDSALEKREVSSGEKQKGQTYKPGSYFGAGTQSDSSLTSTAAHSQKLTRSEDKSPIETKPSEYDDKVPTQIRIQITNAAEKEKKSTKAEDNEASSSDVDTASKEKDFFDKSKMNQRGVNALPKLHQFPKSKFSLLDYDDCDSRDSAKQKSYAPRPYRRRRRKKKKFVPENPMKPIKDFIAFDQKAMEILLRKYMADQNLAGQQHTTQKAPMSNHLPQVETVYNPTQGTNKAQLEASRITKINSISNKNGENAKNSLQSNDASAYDEGVLRSYIKDKTNKAKPEKPFGKEYEDVEWKPYWGKLWPRTEMVRDSLSFQNMKNYGGDVVSSLNYGTSSPTSRIFNPQNPYYQKWLQSPYSNYFYHPPNMNVVNSNSFYDALKLKQELKNHALNKGMMMKDHPSVKTAQKPPHYYNEGNFYGKVEDKDRSPNFPTTAEPTWNYDFNFNKKPFAQKLKSRDFYNPAMKTQTKGGTYGSASSKFIKNMDDEKLFDTTPLRPMDNSKDCDYLDVLDDDYPDDDAGKDLQFDEPIITDVIKKSNKLYDPVAYHHLYNYKNSDVDSEGPADSDDEFDDEYDETTDDDDLDDYSLLANSREADQELSKNSHATSTFQGSHRPEDSFSHLSTFYPRSSQFELKGNSFEQTEYNNPKSEDKFQQGSQTMPLADLKSDIDPPLSGSSNILKKANENTNIFGKNLMKNLNKYSYDDSWKHPDKAQDEKPMSDIYPRFGRKLRKRMMDWQRKLKRSQEYPQIGSRLFYIAKTEMTDKNRSPGGVHSLSRRHDLGIPLTAQFAAPDDDFESDSESDGKRVNGISDDDDDLEVEDNLEDDGEMISEDNVLENVIGKYIMRKRVQSPSELMISAEKGRRLRKRSAETYRQKPRKLLKKRLSSGHLTENNFKKFHRKNFTGKRDIDGDAPLRHKFRRDEAWGCAALCSQNQRKRSPLDLFKKITSKDRDAKKLEEAEARSAGFEPLLLLSDKNLAGPAKETGDPGELQLKKLENQEKAETKLHRGDEPTTSLKEGEKQKSKVSLKLEGPWKLELNDKLLEAKEGGPGRVWSTGEAGHREEGNEPPAGYFGVRNSARRAKRKFSGALPFATGSFQTEVGTSYGRRSDAGRRIRKRSLEPSTARTKTLRQDAGKASPSESLTVQEHNRALHDTENLSEGDSKPQAPHVLQRNSNINGSFVADDEPDPRLPPPGKSPNLKSVFPPSRDANIIRDSRDINEGTSEYLGQQIVDAILSHVSTNPKFKEVIAPALTMRAPAHKEAIEERRRALHQLDFSEQLQSFLQKFLFDLEKLAEQHVRKRMCNEIDKQSKDFLQSLVNIPTGRKETNHDNSETSCSSLEEDVTEPSPTIELLTTLPPPPSPTEVDESTLASLRKKQCLLKKLIDEYQSLSKLEQETLDVNYRYLVKELEKTNRELKPPTNEPNVVLGPGLYCTDDPKKGDSQSKKKKNKKKGFEGTKNSSLSGNVPGQAATGSGKQETTTSRFLPAYFFDPGEQQHPSSSERTRENFENVHSEKVETSSVTPTPPPPDNSFDPLEDNLNNILDLETPVSASEIPQLSVSSPTATVIELPELATLPIPSTPTPQSFDLLPSQNSTLTTDVLQPALASESVRIKQSAPTDSRFHKDDNSLSWSFQNSLHPTFGSHQQSTLHKLNTGDAAGLQLSLTSHGPWISTLDVAKNYKAMPNIPLSKEIPTGNDPPLAVGSKTGKALIAPRDDLSNLSPPRSTLYNRPVFPYRIDKKFFTLKIRPFSQVVGSDSKDKQANCQMLPFQYFLRKYPMQKGLKIQTSTHGIGKPNFYSTFRQKKRRYRSHHRRRAPQVGRKKGRSELQCFLRSPVAVVRD